MTSLQATPRFITIQSHVVSGYCGNKSATFPLQLLGFEVDIVNSVQLSNHTQYKLTRGQVFSSKELEEIHAGLKGNDLLCLYDRILSGYVADVSYIEALANLVQDIKLERQKHGLECNYSLDPVLGDDGIGYYVPDGTDIAAAYTRCLLPLADIITPNRFEASILSGIEIDTTSPDVFLQAKQAMQVFHRMGVQTVVITSMNILAEPDSLICILSHDPSVKKSLVSGNAQEDPSIWTIRVPKLGCQFTGTGDLFAALFSGWLQKTNSDLTQSLENTANTLHSILEDTLAHFNQANDGSALSYELRLVQNQKHILSSIERFKCEKIEI